MSTSLCLNGHRDIPIALDLPLEEIKSTIRKLSAEYHLDFLGDCFLIMSDVVPVDFFCLALMFVSILDMMINMMGLFGQILQQLS